MTFKAIYPVELLQPCNITLYITVSVSIKALWFCIDDRCKRNQFQTGGEFNQAQRDEFHEIYRDAQERADEKYANE